MQLTHLQFSELAFARLFLRQKPGTVRAFAPIYLLVICAPQKALRFPGPAFAVSDGLAGRPSAGPRCINIVSTGGERHESRREEMGK